MNVLLLLLVFGVIQICVPASAGYVTVDFFDDSFGLCLKALWSLSGFQSIGVTSEW